MSIFGSIMSGIFGKSAEAKTEERSGTPGAAPAHLAQTLGTASASGTPSAAAPAAPERSAAPGAAPAEPTKTAGPASATSTPSAAAPATPSSPVDVAAVLNALAAQNKQKLNWRTSIVDLMKLLDLDSSLAARKQLAQELHYSGDINDSASMNIWLHKQVMTKLAENGGKVPEDLKH